MNNLEAILDSITSAEVKLLPVLIHDPQSGELAGLAFATEQGIFAVIKTLAAKRAAATAKAASRPEATFGGTPSRIPGA